MVRISKEFKDKIRDEIKKPAMPERGTSRKLLKTGGRLCVTLRPDWCKQWGLEIGTKVLLFVDENRKLCVTPSTNLWWEEMGKHYSVYERKIVKVGNSLAVSVPQDLLEDLSWKGRRLLRNSDYVTVYEPYHVPQMIEEREMLAREAEMERKVGVKKKAEVEEVEERRPKTSTKVVVASTIVLGLIMSGFIMLSKPSKAGCTCSAPYSFTHFLVRI